MQVKKYRVIEEELLFGKKAFRIETLSFFGILWTPLEGRKDYDRQEVEDKIKELEKEGPAIVDWLFSKN